MRKDEDLEFLSLLSKEAISKNDRAALESYHAQKQPLNKYMIAQLLMKEPVLDAIRRTMKRLSSDTKVDNFEIAHIIADEIIKRDVLDDERSKEACKTVEKALRETSGKAKTAGKQAT